MKQYLAAGAVLLLIVGWGIYAYTNQESRPGHSITIGAFLPLSGDYASLGEEVRRGIELAADETNKNGASIQVVFEDAKSDFGTGPVNAATKLLTTDRVDVGLTMITEEAKPVIPLFANTKTPLLVVWDSNKFLEQASDYTFGSGFSTEKAGEQMAAYAFNTLHLKRIAIFGHKDAWADVITPVFVTTFQSLGGTIVYQDSVDIETTDYRTFIVKIKAVKPDGVYFPLVPPTNAQFVIQARQAGLTVPLLTGDAFVKDIIAQVGAAADGIYLTNTFTDEKEKLTALYRAKYGSEPADVTLVSMGYDGVMKIVEASHESSDTLQEKMLAEFGPTRSAERAENIYQIRGGALQLVTQ